MKDTLRPRTARPSRASTFFVLALGALGLGACSSAPAQSSRSSTEADSCGSVYGTACWQPYVDAVNTCSSQYANDFPSDNCCTAAANHALKQCAAAQLGCSTGFDDSDPASYGCDASWNVRHGGATLGDAQACLDGQLPGVIDPASGRTVCDLPAGTFVLDGNPIPGSSRTEVHVSRPNVVLRGSPQGTILRRGRLGGSVVAVDSGASNSVIEQVTIDGNRFAFDHDTDGAPIFWGCPGANRGIVDLDIAPGSNVVVQNVKLHNAFDTSIVVAGQGSRISGVEIHTARSTGIHIYGDDVTVENSRIETSGTAAITVHAARDRVIGNQLVGNRHEQPDGVPGGELNLEPESTGATISGNTIDGLDYAIAEGPISVVDVLTGAPHSCASYLDVGGRYPLGVDGIEGYGTYHTLSGNTVIRNRNSGMLLKGALQWVLSGNTVSGNGAGIVFLPYLGQNNVGVTLRDTTISGNARSGLELRDMVLDGSGGGGCSGATNIFGNGQNVLVDVNVASVYVSTCH